MKDYDVAKDSFRIRQYFGLSQAEFAERIGVSRVSLARSEARMTMPNPETMERVYAFAYSNGLLLNQAKADFFLEERGKKLLLFHGARSEIKGPVDNSHSIPPNDFGDGFYAGTSLNQAATWIAEKPNSSVYAFYLDSYSKMRSCSFEVGREWMYAVLYFRGAFRDFEPNEEVLKIVEEVRNSDYIVAPIADNQMYQILNRFANNEITDEACYHALCATNLGLQFVFKSMEACSKLVAIDRLYLCSLERKDYLSSREGFSRQSQSKADLALVEYRRKGVFFDELFKRIR